jgi:hypothetical protein
MLPTHSAGNARGLYASEASSCVMANTFQQKYLPHPPLTDAVGRHTVSSILFGVLRIFRIKIQPALPVPHFEAVKTFVSAPLKMRFPLGD